MAEPGDLTTLGWLYEGNFDEWVKRMNIVFRASDQFDHGATILRLAYPNKARQSVNPEMAAAVRLICANISPKFSARIPETAHSNSIDLLQSLKAHARPFNFLGLPAEIRVMVYEHCIQTGEDWEIHNNGSMTGRPLDPILHVCRVIRAEALGPFIQVTTFGMRIEAWEEGRVAAATRAWVAGFARSNTKALRYFYLGQVEEYEDDVVFGFDAKHGLTVCMPRGGLHAETRAALRKRVAEVEADRKALGLQGEAIVLALTSLPKLRLMDEPKAR